MIDNAHALAEQTPRRRRTPLEAEAERRLGHAFVCLVGTVDIVPRRFGDNQGAWPVRLEVHADWRQAGHQADIASPVAAVARLSTVGVQSKAHALRLKGVLDEMLLGRRDGNDVGLRYSWRDALAFGPLERWWPSLLGEAVLICELEAVGFDVFDVAEHERRVSEMARRIGRTGR